MKELEVWWSPAAACWRVEDGEMFTYYALDEVVGHFTNRQQPAVAMVFNPPGLIASADGLRATALIAALQRAGVTVKERQS